MEVLQGYCVGYSSVPYIGYSRVLRGYSGVLSGTHDHAAREARRVAVEERLHDPTGNARRRQLPRYSEYSQGYSEYSQGGSDYPHGVLRVLTRGTQRSGFMIPPGADTSCMRGRYSRGTKAVLERYSRGTLMDTIAACGRSVRLFVGLPVAVLSACCSFVCLPVVVLFACCCFDVAVARSPATRRRQDRK